MTGRAKVRTPLRGTPRSKDVALRVFRRRVGRVGLASRDQQHHRLTTRMNTRPSDTDATSAPPVISMTLDGFDPDAMNARVRGGFQRTQLAPGRFRGQVLRANLGATRVDWGRYNLPLLATGQMPHEDVVLALISPYRAPGTVNGHVITPPTPVVVTEKAVLDYRMPSYSQWFTFHLPRRLAEAACVSLPDVHVGPLTTEPLQAARAANCIRNALAIMRGISRRTAGIPDPEAYLRNLEAELLDVFSAITAGTSRSAPGREGHPAKATVFVRRATEIIDAHLDEPLSIGEICREVGCDWKRLERSFKTVVEVTPKRFLTLARLNRARTMLLRAAPDDSVTRIAGRCGIHHLGRFSQYYVSLFGELPSETLAHGRKG